MDEKTMENLAREYRTALSSDDGTIDRIIRLEEEQLDSLDAASFRSPGRQERTVSYLKSLTYRTLSLLAARKNETYLPSVRTRCAVQNPLNRFASLQVDIFLLYDEAGDYASFAELLSLENRKAALIAGLL